MDSLVILKFSIEGVQDMRDIKDYLLYVYSVAYGPMVFLAPLSAKGIAALPLVILSAFFGFRRMLLFTTYGAGVVLAYNLFYPDVFSLDFVFLGIAAYYAIGIGVSLVIRRIRKTGASLKKERDFVDLLLKTVANAVIVLDEDGKTIRFNHMSENISGYSADEILGKSPIELLVPEEDRQSTTDFFNSIKEQEFRRDYESRWKSKSGETRLLNWQVNWFRDPESGRRYLISSGTDITEKRERESYIEYVTFNDTLTGCYNRAFLEAEIRRLDVRRNLPISIVFADVNGLKLINDAFGHSKGDELLKILSEILRRSCRSEEIIARYGGDEFVILLPETKEQKAWEIVQRALDLCNLYKDFVIPLSMSFGVATKTSQSQNILAVISDAERKMYESKLARSIDFRKAIVPLLKLELNRRVSDLDQKINTQLEMADSFSRWLSLDTINRSNLNLLVELQDIGFVSLPVDTKLMLSETCEELHGSHVESGYRIARNIDGLLQISDDILYHHERWDGLGFPFHLKADHIPYLSRTVSVLNLWYCSRFAKKMDLEDSIASLAREAGKSLDPLIVSSFQQYLTGGR